MAQACSLARGTVTRAALIFFAAGAMSCQTDPSTQSDSRELEGRFSMSSGGSDSMFAREIRPILDANCIRCHGVKSKKAELDLRSTEGIRRGSENGEVIVAGDAEQSRLYQLVSAGKMPPGRSKKLTRAEVDLFRRWIEGGARF